MNHTHLVKIITRAIISSTFLLSFRSYGSMDERRYEQYPALGSAFQGLEAEQITLSDLKKSFEEMFTTWSLDKDGDKTYKINNACALACIEVLNGNHSIAKTLFQDAADQESRWGAHSLGLYALNDLDHERATYWFQRAIEIDEAIGIIKYHAPSYRHAAVLLGVPPEEKKDNMLARIDTMILNSSKESKRDLLRTLAEVAAKNNDTYAQQKCLDVVAEDVGQGLGITEFNDNQAHEKTETTSIPSSMKAISSHQPVDTPKQNFIDKDTVLQKINGITNNGRRIAALKELSRQNAPHAQYLLGIYNLDRDNRDKKSTTEGWNLLQTAADGDDSEACVAFIVRGLQDPEKRDLAVKYVQNLLDDDMRMARIKLSDDALASIYKEYGAYCAQTRNASKAIGFLEKAADLGEHTHAFTLAKLHENNGNFLQAKKHYALVKGDKQRQAEWNNAVLSYSKESDRASRTTLLKQFSKQCMGTDDHVLLQNDIEPLLKLQQVQRQLKVDAEAGSEEALLVLAFCAHKKIMESSTTTPYNYCVEAIYQANQHENIVCKDAALMIMRQLSSEGDKDAALYLRKYAPTNAQKELDQIYSSETISNVALTNAQYKELKGDAELNDVALAFKAHTLLGHEYLRQAKAESHNPQKAYQLYKKAIESLRAGITLHAVIQSGDQTAEKKMNEMRVLLTNALTGVARVTKDAQEQERYYREAADDQSNPNPQACTWMYRRTNDEKYFRKALMRGEAEARWIQAQKDLETNPNPAYAVRTLDSLLLEIEKDKDCLSDEIKAQLYHAKAKLCSTTQDKIKWQCKAVEVGNFQKAFAVCLHYINEHEYDKARQVIGKVPKDDVRFSFVPLIKKHIEYCSAPNAQKSAKREAVLKECSCILRGALHNPLDIAEKVIIDEIIKIMNISQKRTTNLEKEILILQNYMKQDYKNVDAISKEIDKNGSSVTLSVLADASWMEGRCADAIALELMGLSQEKCPTCRRYSRAQLYKFFNDLNTPMRVDASSAADEIMQKIYKHLKEDKDESEAALYVEQKAIRHFAHNAYRDNNPQELIKWYPLVSDSFLMKKRYAGLLHDHNMLGGTPAQALQKSLDIYTEMAVAGNNPDIQQYLAVAYSESLVVPSGARVEIDMDKAIEFADMILLNPKAQKAQRAIAHCILARYAYNKMKEDEKGKSHDEWYDQVEKHSRLAMEAGDYTVASRLLEVSTIDQAEALYRKYFNDPELWKTASTVLPFAIEVFKKMPHHAKEIIIEKVMPSLQNMNINKCDKNAAAQVINDTQTLVSLIAEKTEQYQEYGFDSRDEMGLTKFAVALTYLSKKESNFESRFSPNVAQQLAAMKVSPNTK